MKKQPFYLLMSVMVMTSCATHHYQVEAIKHNRILIDKRYDNATDSKAEAFIAPYKSKVDSIMSPIVGRSAQYLFAKRPESNLSNLLCDILVWGGKIYNEKPEFALYNIGGMRAGISEGIVTFGNVIDVAPFENKICFFDMTGKDVRRLFEQVAFRHGEGVSRGVNLVITKDGKLVSAKIHGEEIDDARVYRIASIDYLAQGNDGLTALKNKTNVNSPKDESNNIRYIIMDYFRELATQGKAAEAKVEGRIVEE